MLSNSTNTLQSCGISIYYPFYNKKYYEKSWGEVYGEIGVLNEYASYLNKYDDIWLKSDKLDGVAASKTPTTLGDSKYSLELTPEQAENYANANQITFIMAGYEEITDNNNGCMVSIPESNYDKLSINFPVDSVKLDEILSA